MFTHQFTETEDSISEYDDIHGYLKIWEIRGSTHSKLYYGKS